MRVPGDRVTVLAVDDQEIFLHVARELIAATPGFEQVGEALSGPEALELAQHLHPDLVLLDVRMRGMDGIETARRLLAAEPGTVVALVSLDELPDAALVEPGGSAGFLRKQDLSTRVLREFWVSHRPRAGRRPTGA